MARRTRSSASPSPDQRVSTPNASRIATSDSAAVAEVMAGQSGKATPGLNDISRRVPGSAGAAVSKDSAVVITVP